MIGMMVFKCSGLDIMAFDGIMTMPFRKKKPLCVFSDISWDITKGYKNISIRMSHAHKWLTAQDSGHRHLLQIEEKYSFNF